MDSDKQAALCNIEQLEHARSHAEKSTAHAAISTLIAPSAWKVNKYTQEAYEALYKYAESIHALGKKLPRDEEQLRCLFDQLQKETKEADTRCKQARFWATYHQAVCNRLEEQVVWPFAP